MNALISGVRWSDESQVEFRGRLRRLTTALKHYIRYGQPANASRDKSHYRKGNYVAEPAQKYVPGPHRKHKPHEVKQEAVLKNGKLHTFVVMHPGTLVKEKT